MVDKKICATSFSHNFVDVMTETKTVPVMIIEIIQFRNWLQLELLEMLVAVVVVVVLLFLLSFFKKCRLNAGK